MVQPLERMARRVNSVRGKRRRSDLDIEAAIIMACKDGRRSRLDIMLSARLTVHQVKPRLMNLVSVGFIELAKEDREKWDYYIATDKGAEFLKKYERDLAIKLG